MSYESDLQKLNEELFLTGNEPDQTEVYIIFHSFYLLICSKKFRLLYAYSTQVQKVYGLESVESCASVLNIILYRISINDFTNAERLWFELAHLSP